MSFGSQQVKRKSVNDFLFVSVLVLVTIKFLLSYSFHLEKHQVVSQLVDYVLVVNLILCLLFNLKKVEEGKMFLLALMTFFLIYVVLVNLYYEVALNAFVYYTRMAIPILLYVTLISIIDDYIGLYKRFYGYFMLLLPLLGFLGLFFMPENFNHGEVKRPTYFSGLHKSSYIYAIALIGIYYFLKIANGRIKYLLVLPAFFMLYMVVEGWGIRTAMTLVLAFCIFQVFMHVPSFLKYIYWILFSVLFSLLFFMYAVDMDWNSISSGRLNMWEYKFEIFEESSIWGKIFGHGYGSDYVEVDGWFGEKDSHNTYIQTLTEHGMIGLLVLCLVIFCMYKIQSDRLSMGLVLGYAVTGLVSNGIAYRLVPGYVFALTMIFLYVVVRNERK